MERGTESVVDPDQLAVRPAGRMPAGGWPGADGGLEQLLDVRPAFARSLRGYDKVQVDNYVAWAETEMEVASRENEHLLARLAACAAELETVRRAQRPPAPRETAPASERVAELLRLAAEQADEQAATAAEQAGRILAEARAEADARLRKAEAIVEAARAAGDEVLAQARRERAAVEEEIEDLRRQRDESRESLRRLTAQIGEALQAVVLTGDERAAVAGAA